MLAAPTGQLSDSQQPEPLQLLVKLPPHMSKFFEEAGYLETVLGELRTQARLRVRCETEIESDFVPPFLGIKKRRAKVLTKDLSRSGLGILTHEQLWPGETFWIALHGRRLHVRVVRCRKLADACFEVGGNVLSVE